MSWQSVDLAVSRPDGSVTVSYGQHPGVSGAGTDHGDLHLLLGVEHEGAEPLLPPEVPYRDVAHTGHCRQVLAEERRPAPPRAHDVADPGAAVAQILLSQTHPDQFVKILLLMDHSICVSETETLVLR